MKRPSFQFYPADWRNNAKLRRCTWEARGAWLEVMCLLHDSEEYGVLRWPLKEIAQAIGAPIRLLRELADKGVMRGSDEAHDGLIYTPRSGRKDGEPVSLVDSGPGPCWLSSRMVVDEYVREKRGNPDLHNHSPNKSPKVSPNPPIGDLKSDLPTSTSTTTSPSLRSGDSAPKRAPRPKRSEITLQAYLDICKAEGKKPIPPDHPIRDYCRDAGITDEMVQVAWLVFRDKYLTGELASKGYKDWPGHFANNIKSRWQNLWFVNAEGAAEWTATGQQARRVIDTRSKQKLEQAHEPA